MNEEYNNKRAKKVQGEEKEKQKSEIKGGSMGRGGVGQVSKQGRNGTHGLFKPYVQTSERV